jgi:hypothetical protein
VMKAIEGDVRRIAEAMVTKRDDQLLGPPVGSAPLESTTITNSESAENNNNAGTERG